MTAVMDHPRVLLVSYLFPPWGGVVVQRALAMARYMPAAGVDISVLTARNPISQHGSDPDLERMIPPGVHVCHSATWEPPRLIQSRAKRVLAGKQGAGASTGEAVRPASSFRRFANAVVERVLFPDAHLLWVKPSIQAAARMIRQEGIGTVILTLPPFSLLVMAIELRKLFPKLRIVLDLRDEWLDYHLAEYDKAASRWKLRHAADLEKAAVQASDVVVTVTPPWVNGLVRRYPDEPPQSSSASPTAMTPTR